MKKAKLILLCLFAGATVMSCKKEEKPTDEKPDTKPEETVYADYTEKIAAFNFSMDMVYVEGGTFNMGDTVKGDPEIEGPVHSVTVSSYYIGKFEVTQAQWKTFMGDNPVGFGYKGDSLPAERITWFEAKAFCDSLSKYTGKKYMLPTEAQWEFAARGGVKSKGYLYSGSNTADEVAWFRGNSDMKSHAVGMKLPNELGIYDMSGNVWEWCSDWRSAYTTAPAVDPTGPAEPDPDFGAYRVERGGAFLSRTENVVRITNRYEYDPTDFNNILGLRVVCLIDKK